MAEREKLDSIFIFVRAVQHRSFSVAARQLGMSPSAVSRAVQRLESRLGARLLNRTTRSLSLTGDGAVFYESCQRILGELEEAEQALSKAKTIPTGTLRVNLTVALGRMHIIPALPRLAAQYPDLKFDITLDDRKVDLIEEGLDAVVRIGSSPDSNLIMRPLGIARLVVCAAPSYLQRYGEPQTLEDLQHHNCLNLVLSQTGRDRDWSFEKHGEMVRVPVSGNFRLNHAESLVEAAIAGAGVVQLFNYLVASAISRGELQPLLVNYEGSGMLISVIYPQRRYLSAKVRVFVEFMTDLMGELRSRGIVGS